MALKSSRLITLQSPRIETAAGDRVAGELATDQTANEGTVRVALVVEVVEDAVVHASAQAPRLDSAAA